MRNTETSVTQDIRHLHQQ